MTHPDAFKLIAAIDSHDKRGGNTKDANGNVAGVDHFSLLGAAGRRAQLAASAFGNLRKVLNPKQQEELQQLLAMMWMDGFAVGVAYDQENPTA